MKKMILLIVTVILFSSCSFSAFSADISQKFEDYSVGDVVEFGSYPQSRVTDSDLISNLDNAEKKWISYDYYSGRGEVDDGKMVSSDYMKYADFAYNNLKYRAVLFTNYRPEKTGEINDEAKSYQDDNGYLKNTVYYFSFDKIKWRFLNPKEGLVLCESLIDSQAFNNYNEAYQNEHYGDALLTFFSSDYAHSSIRKWLNNDFYNTAFSDSEKNKISANNTDNIFLLSKQDILNEDYGFSNEPSAYDEMKMAVGTDYAKCQGLYVRQGKYYAGNSNYYLCSSVGSDMINCVSCYGTASDNNASYFTSIGIRPAFRFVPTSSLYSCEHKNTKHIVENSTCTKQGIEYDYCNDCTEKINKVLLPLANHSLTEWQTVNAPKCTENGERIKTCTVCKQTIERETITAPGHTLTEWQTVSTPKCTENGERVKVCTVCKQTIERETITAPGHTLTEWQTVTEPKCTENGERVKTCTVCKQTIERETITATGHTLTEWQTVSAPKCTENGERVKVCTVCKQTIEKETITAPGHTLTEWQTVNAPKCTENGERIKTCTVCKQTIERETITAPGHIDGDWVITKQATFQEDGMRTLYCSVCKQPIRSETIQRLNSDIALTVPESIELNYKSSKKIYPDVQTSSDYSVKYSSSNSSVATVDGNGNVYGAKRGSATVSVSVTNEYGITKTAKCEVKVKYAVWQWIIKIVLFGWIWY